MKARLRNGLFHAAGGLLLFAATTSASETALDRYVAQRDAVYGWKLVSTLPGEGDRTFVLELTSQRWRSEKDVDRPVWKHWLTVTVPNQVKTSKAFLYIGEGDNTDPAPSKPSRLAERIAKETGSIAAEVQMVPNQPLRFADSPSQAREEDDIIAYTRVKHFQTKDDTWLVRLAMVKSGVRAMDAVQEFLASEAGGKITVDQFVVAGASKRGWTTWLVGVVDRRVIAIMPLVIDALHSEEVTKHHFEAYGYFSPALDDYVKQGLFPHKIGTPEYREVLKIEDPYEYRDRPSLRMPKFLINAAGDQFFLPDGSQFYFAEMPEEKHLRYVPNAKHNLAGTDAADSVLTYYEAVLADRPRPRFTWHKQKDGALVVNVTDRPTEVNLWQASNPKARDFRVDTIGKAYHSSPLKESSRGLYIGQVAKPGSGFTAFFVELVYAGAGSYPFKFTTEVSVVPDVLPYKWQDAMKKYASTAGAGAR